ncbi:MAG TPA: hypothetical protein VN894_11385, partial [Polyangiaceae bacterium]|nr:hypothetical protein [Polyangiaceae bacterium]
SEAPTGQLLAELAPAAPTARYAIRGEVRRWSPNARLRRVAWWTAAAVAGGIAIGAVVTLAVVARHANPKGAVIPGSAPTLAASEAPPAATARKVVVPLPFVATHVTFDENARDLNPAADVLSFDVPVESGPRHRVTALALDGTHAEAYVREQDGIASPDADGYTFVAPAEQAGGEVRRELRGAGARAPGPIGTVHHGFTKLK